MKRSTIAALVFGGILAVVAVANVPPVADRINSLLGLGQEEPDIAAGGSAKEQVEELATPDSKGDRPAAPDKPDEIASVQEEPAGAASERMADVAEGEPVTIPTFGLLRVEPDGSTVIAGQAGPNAEIEILVGTERIASAAANSIGDFVAVLDEPLAPGDYEIVLRATDSSGASAMSEETAIVSVPEKGREGELLALVEQPGAPSRLINTPEPAGLEATGEVQATGDDTQPPADAADAPAQPEAPAAEEEAAPAVAEQATPLEEDTAAAPADAPAVGETTAVAPAPQEQAEQRTEVASAPESSAEKPQAAARQTDKEDVRDVRIEAVEIDGETVFVAGSAPPGAQVRVYANDILLGDTEASPSGRFLVQANRDLPVGDYIMRADVIDRATADVVARAAVPFSRSEGEKLAAVAVETETPDAGVSESAPAEEPVALAEPSDEVAVKAPQPSATLPDTPPEITDPRTVSTTRLQTTSSSVIIRRGDTLWEISRRIYGRGIRYTTIYLANQTQIADPDKIWPGQVFALPENSPSPENEQPSVN